MVESEVKPVIVEGRRIGPGEAVFVIAEAGINHNGSVGRAKELIDAAAESGADAVKFQKRNLAEIYQKELLDNPNSGEQKFQVYLPLLREFELSDATFVELEAYAKEKGVMFLVNPWDKKSCDDIERLLDVPLYKVGSPDLTNDELLEYLADKGKPMILSTGMSKLEEIEHAAKLLKSRGVSFALLHCNSTYPAPFDEINLKFLDTLGQFGVPVGYSGHERGIAVSIAAVGRGACVIERHLTVDKTLEGPDHKASLLPEEFRMMVDGIREAEKAVGSFEKKLSRAEIMNRELLGKSIVAVRFIADGTVITRDMLTTKSPAKGLSPQFMDKVVGVTAQRDLFAGEALTEDDISGAVITKDFDSSGIKWQWGPVVRFSDYENYLRYKPDLFEFHLSDKDLDEQLPVGNFEQQLIVHAPEYMHRTYLNPAAENYEERKIAIDTLRRTVELAKRLGESFKGVPKIVVHPGGITLQPAPDKQKFMDLFADTLDQIKSSDVMILPENLPPRPWVFGGEWVGNIWLLADEIVSFLRDTGYFMVLDTSHLALSCNAAGVDLAGEIEKLQPFVRHLHVADASGIGEEGLQIGEGRIDWEKALAPMAGYEHTMIPEIWQGHLHGGRGFLQAMEHLKPFMK